MLMNAWPDVVHIYISLLCNVLPDTAHWNCCYPAWLTLCLEACAFYYSCLGCFPPMGRTKLDAATVLLTGSVFHFVCSERTDFGHTNQTLFFDFAYLWVCLHLMRGTKQLLYIHLPSAIFPPPAWLVSHVLVFPLLSEGCLCEQVMSLQVYWFVLAAILCGLHLLSEESPLPSQ